ncbi:MAG: hypothetical protein LLG14_24910 [Nocardiaceae bacterium]|nr:hypothetical protein [Nocardiaceae bacterium]
MGGSPIEGMLDELAEKRDELLIALREADAKLVAMKRQLGEVNNEIDSLRRVNAELLRRHPELSGQHDAS